MRIRVVSILFLISCTAVGCRTGPVAGQDQNGIITGEGLRSSEESPEDDDKPHDHRVKSWVADEPGSEAAGRDFSAIRSEARAKFVPIITEAREVFGDDEITAQARFSAFKQANPELFAFDGASAQHIDVWNLDGDRSHNQVFVWAWLGDIGVVGFSDGHVESTQDRALFDRVVSAGRGALISTTMTWFEDGIEHSKQVPAGPGE